MLKQMKVVLYLYNLDYTDNKTLIPKNSSVIVKRVPNSMPKFREPVRKIPNTAQNINSTPITKK